MLVFERMSKNKEGKKNRERRIQRVEKGWLSFWLSVVTLIAFQLCMNPSVNIFFCDKQLNSFKYFSSEVHTMLSSPSREYWMHAVGGSSFLVVSHGELGIGRMDGRTLGGSYSSHVTKTQFFQSCNLSRAFTFPQPSCHGSQSYYVSDALNAFYPQIALGLLLHTHVIGGCSPILPPVL